MDLSRDDEALKAFDKAIEINSTYIDARISKGLALSAHGMHDEAMQAFDEAIEIDPKMQSLDQQRLCPHGSGQGRGGMQAFDSLEINPKC